MKNTINRKNNRPSNISYIVNANIFDAAESKVFGGNFCSSVIIPHVCNNINAFGAGFAGAVSDKYPAVKENFHLLGSKAKLGNVQYISTKRNNSHKTQLIFANMIAQNRLTSKDNPRPLNYEALVNCMVDIRRFTETLINREENKVEIHCPKFGSGLAGGNWIFIANLIEDIWSDLDVFVYSPTKLSQS